MSYNIMNTSERSGGLYERMLEVRQAASTELADKKIIEKNRTNSFIDEAKGYLKRKWEDEYSVNSNDDRIDTNSFPNNLRVSAEDVNKYTVHPIDPHYPYSVNSTGSGYSSSTDSPSKLDSAIDSPFYSSSEDHNFMSVFEVLESSDATRLARNDFTRVNTPISYASRRPLSPSIIDPTLPVAAKHYIKAESPPVANMTTSFPSHARPNQIKQFPSIPKAAVSFLPAFIPSSQRPTPLQFLPNKIESASYPAQLNPLILPDHSQSSDFKLPSHYLIQCVPWYFYTPKSLTLDGMHQRTRIQPLTFDESPYILPENLILGDEDAEVERYEPELEEVIGIFNGLKNNSDWWQNQKILDFQNGKGFGDGMLRFGIHEGWTDVF